MSNLRVIVSEDGVWLEFKTAGGSYALVNVEAVLVRDPPGTSLRDKVLAQWCEERRRKSKLK